MLLNSVDENGAGVLEQPVKVLELGVYRGPHFYSHTPMIRVMLDLGRMEYWPSDRLSGFSEALLRALPGLALHGCCYGRPGGFLSRLREGTWFGHIAEHAALELQSLAGSAVARGKTRSVKGRRGVYNVMFAYQHEEVGVQAARIALELLNSLLPADLQGLVGLDRLCNLEGDYDFGERLELLRSTVRRCSLGPTTQSIVDEAVRRGIPTRRLDDRSLVLLGHGKHQQRIRASISGRTSLIGADTAGDKELTKKILAAGGIPVPRGVLVQSADEAARAAGRLSLPLVVKPLDGNHGRGVTTRVVDESQLRSAFDQARAEARGSSVIVEEFFEGRDHRILVVDGEVTAVAERVPAQVTGDGLRTIAELVEEVNRDPRRGNGHENVMTRIRLDARCDEFLARSGLSRSSVPSLGQVVPLCQTANLSTGGTAVDRTDEIHPENAEIARRAAILVGLDIAGVDFIAPDISASVHETGGGIIEVNAAPGFRMHLEPSEGRSRNPASAVVDMLFPEGSRGRIPIVAITGTNGKSTTGRMIKQIFRQDGRSVGLTSTSGVYVNDFLVSRGDATGPKSARMVLQDPAVEIAVLETARGGLLREGLAFDQSDVGVVLNVSPDHLGLKGIDSLQDLADVKSLIVETVSRKGVAVLNADDPLVRAMERRARGHIAWFSMNGGAQMPGWLAEHVAGGGLAVVREPGTQGGTIVVYRKGRRDALMEVGEIPGTLDGLAGFNIANALAAVAAAAAQGVRLGTIRCALSEFGSTFDQNPGRLNIHDAHGFRVIVDYAHNAAGLAAIGEVVLGLRRRFRRSIGVISIPGDRRDQDILEMGRVAAGLFDHLFLREDPDTRGRPRGEVMKLLRQGALAGGCRPESISMIRGERDATDAALRFARTGDLLVITPSEVQECWEQVLSFAPDAEPLRTAGRSLIQAA